MIKGMHHTGFVVTDLDRSVGFYRDAVGLELVTEYERTGAPISQVVGYDGAHLKIAILTAGDGHLLELIQYVSPAPAERSTEVRAIIGGNHLAFLVDDMEGTLRTLVASGATSLNPPASTAPGRKACYLQDPDRNWIELVELSE